MLQSISSLVPGPAADAPQGSDVATALLQVVEAVSGELHPAKAPPAAALDSRLDRDLGIDSLGRAELIARIEREFSVRLPEHTLNEAETPYDLLAAILAHRNIAPPRRSPRPHLASSPTTMLAPTTAQTLCAALDWHAERHAARPHIFVEDIEEEPPPISYGGLAEKARRAAGGLRDAAIAPGDRVAIMLPTGVDFFVAFFGALYAGAIPVPIYPPARATQIEGHLRRQAGILDNAAARILVTTPVLHAPAALLHSLVPSLAAVATIGELTLAPAGGLPRVDDAASTALLQYTSGSTGAPKGVVLSHANVLANIRAIGMAMAASAADVFVSWLPLYHDMGLIGAWLGSLYYGAPLVLMPPQRFLARPERWLWAIHHHRGTLSAAPNFAFEMCLRNINDGMIEGLDLSSLRLVANGSEPVSATTLRRFLERFEPYGFRATAMAPAYGLAESAVGLTLPPRGRITPLIDRISRSALTERGIAEPARGDDGAIELVSCGQPLPGHEVRVVDDTGHELAERREGRLQFRGPSATSGYFRDPAKTRALFSDGWLETGDLAYLAAGDLFITGRSKDIIIRAGRHLYPSEIEQAVGAATGAADGSAAAFGSRDQQSGTERLVVVVETTASTDEQPALRQRVAAAAISVAAAPPEDIVFVPPGSLPKTASGKLRRAAARELYEAGTLGRRRSARQQLRSLTVAAAMPSLRRLLHIAGAQLYAGYWWAVIGTLAPIIWGLVMVLPRPAWRWAAVRIAARLAFVLTGTGFSVARPDGPSDNAIIVSNHASYLDGLALAAAFPGTLRFAVKGELLHKPVARLALRRLGALFVERSDAERGATDVRDAIAAARHGGRFVFFPEGTLTRAPGLLPFRLGAFAVAASCGIPVVPVAISGTRSVLRGDQWFPRNGRISIKIGAPIAPDGATLADAARLRDAARANVLAMCGEPDLAGE